MSITVILCIFSGRTNPKYILHSSQEKELHDRINKLKKRDRRRVAEAAPDNFAMFRLIRQTKSNRSEVRCGGGLVEFPLYPYSYKDDAGVALFLLECCPAGLLSKKLKNDLAAYIREIPPQQKIKYPRSEKCAANPSPDAQVFDGLWASGGWMGIPVTGSQTLCNNCYDYANYQVTSTFSQPGLASGNKFTNYDCKLSNPANVSSAAIRDGLVKVNNFTDVLKPGQGWYVALFVGKLGDEHDFHWLKQDRSGCWSHKRGAGTPSRRDGTFHFIPDPRTAILIFDGGMATYKRFCGFFRTHAGVTIKGSDSPTNCWDPGW